MLSTEDVSRVEQRLKKEKDEANWAGVAAEYMRLVGKFPERFDYWIQLSLSLQKSNIELRDWKNHQLAQYSAINAYSLVKNKNDKEKEAIALLVYGNTTSPDTQYDSPSYLEILQEINSLVNLKDFRKNNPEYAELMPFQYLNTRVNNETSTPSACFLFAHPLNSKNVQYADFVTLTPKVDVDLKVNGRELCISPLKYGENYNVLFKKGLSSSLEEKTEENLEISFRVKDQNSRLSFTNRAYF